MPAAISAEDLYGLDPEEFVAGRNALAKQLRADGEKDEAARVAKLRRPPATAWALNRLARDRAQVVDAALAASGGLRAAMEDALAGDASGIREAQAAERAAVEAAVSAAASYLASSGDRTRQTIAATLRAAAVDGDVAAALRAGVLAADHEAAGFGLDALGTVDVAPRRTDSPAAPVRQPAAPAPVRPPRVDAAEAARRRQEQARHAKLVSHAERLERRAALLRADADAAEVAAAEAESAAAEARRLASGDEHETR